MSVTVLDAPAEPSSAARQITVDFMYLDLDACTRCVGTDANLDAALAEVSRLLAAAGAEVAVRKKLVASAEQARALRFVSSPTIRVDGQDIALELRESRCESCESCACNGEIACRVWVWQGREYTEAPKEMIVDAILRAVYAGKQLPAGASDAVADVPENLERFFAGKARQQTAGSESCCAPAEQASCCEPAEKASCCGGAPAGSCGCR